MQNTNSRGKLLANFNNGLQIMMLIE